MVVGARNDTGPPHDQELRISKVALDSPSNLVDVRDCNVYACAPVLDERVLLMS